jgi:hypothetical protein
MTVRGAGGSEETKTYFVLLTIDGRLARVECQTQTFRDEYQFDLRIGMNVLVAFELSLNYSRNLLSMSWAH